ncbi:MAG: hypothetical protein J0G94_07735 [Sphingomonadales bacterium]|mgnify:FL=1|nr:hypothetical protein [Sphingomonas sp. SCN 67-18]MBN8830511.1 hypothetical protein [Sphingomonadales bacterium]ODU19555.1 MAG: hypothetical protein ABS87_13895 [Sphingomonas sp. SCN 67-18]
MARKPSALAGIFDDEPEAPAPELVAESTPARAPARSAPRARRTADVPAPERRSSHPGKKPVLIHIPEDMHRTLRQLSVEEGGEPLTVVTERLLRQYLVQRGHARFAP